MRPLAVLEPGHVVAGSDVHVLCSQRVLHLREHGVGLADLLADQPLPLQHVEKVSVAAEIELVGMVEMYPALLEESGQNAMDDGRSNLRLNVVADNGEVALLESLAPVVL